MAICMYKFVIEFSVVCALLILVIHSRRSPQPRSGAAGEMYCSQETGTCTAPNYRLYIRDSEGPVSALHDVPLWAERGARLANMVVLTPRWSNDKMEISLSDPLNPLRHKLNKGSMQFVSNVFPHHGYMWNFGALPQTWEDPRHVDPHTKTRGDNEPVDVVEIGQRVLSCGQVVPVKILGALALIDEGRTAWKLIAVNAHDPDAARLSDVADVEALYPGLLRATVEWFRLYKVPDGKPPNQFAFDGEAKDAAFAHRVVDEVHEFWRKLMYGEVSDPDEISMMNVTLPRRAARVDRASAARELARRPPPHPASYVLPSADQHWCFVRR